MKVGSELVDAQIEMVINDAALAALTVKVSKIVFVITTNVAYVGTSTGWRRLSGEGALGDVRNSTLDESRFATENGNTWVLADGRDVTGSDWANLLLTNFIPDYRGIFLRGHDGGSGNDVDGDKSIATIYPDKTAINGLGVISSGAHQHSLYGGNGVDSYTSGYSSMKALNAGIASNAVISGGAHVHSLTGDTQTQPIHGITYIYIKINR